MQKKLGMDRGPRRGAAAASHEPIRDIYFTVRARPGCLGALGVLRSISDFSMALLYGRAGRLTALCGGFRPGQASAELVGTFIIVRAGLSLCLLLFSATPVASVWGGGGAHAGLGSWDA